MVWNKGTLEKFIKNALEFHGNKFDYSLVDYIDSKTKVKIICPIHGVFEQTPQLHLYGGCKKCATDNTRINQENFMDRALKIHGNKYDYSLTKCITSNSMVKIICPIHGVFEQKVSLHLSGKGCRFCGYDNNTLNKESFIEHSKQKHGDLYDYSLVDYVDYITEVKIICSVHGIFEQKPRCHLQGGGCKKCFAERNRSNTEDFIHKSNKIHNYKYDYSLVEYFINSEKVKIICPIHGVFEQLASSHLSGKGCIKCANVERKTLDQFIAESKKLHGDRYDYRLSNYVNINTKVKIICPIHGVFEQTPIIHLRGCGCPNCKTSKGENKIRKLLENLKIEYEPQFKFDDCKYKYRLRFDYKVFIDNQLKLLEYQGIQHYEIINFGHSDYSKAVDEFELIKIRDNIKKEYCETHNIDILYIPYTKTDYEIVEMVLEFLKFDKNNISEILESMELS